VNVTLSVPYSPHHLSRAFQILLSSHTRLASHVLFTLSPLLLFFPARICWSHRLSSWSHPHTHLRGNVCRLHRHLWKTHASLYALGKACDLVLTSGTMQPYIGNTASYHTITPPVPPTPPPPAKKKKLTENFQIVVYRDRDLASENTASNYRWPVKIDPECSSKAFRTSTTLTVP
jgi:hypothetical protein